MPKWWIELASPPESEGKQARFTHRLAWFFGIAAASLLVTTAVAYALRGLLFIG